MIDMRQMIDQEKYGDVHGAMIDATRGLVEVVIPPGRAAWAMRSLQDANAPIVVDSQRNDDGSVSFAVVEDSPVHSILVQIRDYQPKAKKRRKPLSGMSFYFWAVLACGVFFIVIGAWVAGVAAIVFAFAVGIPERRIGQCAKRLFEDDGQGRSSIRAGADRGAAKRNTNAHLALMVWAVVLFVALAVGVLMIGGVL